MKLVTIATHSEKYFPILLESCKRVGAEINVLGWGQKWNGFMMKYNLLGEYIRDLPDDEIVCIIDSYDVVILEPLDKLEAQFRKTGARIAVAKNIDTLLLRYIFGKCKGIPLNAGTYIGYVGDLRKMVVEICNMHDCNDKKLDDQRILTTYCNKHDVYIDQSCELFFLIVRGIRNYDVTNGKLVIKHNDVLIHPCILHAPANVNINSVLTELGYDVGGIDLQSAKYWKNMFVHHWRVTVIIIIIIMIILVFTLLIIYRRISRVRQRSVSARLKSRK